MKKGYKIIRSTKLFRHSIGSRLWLDLLSVLVNDNWRFVNQTVFAFISQNVGILLYINESQNPICICLALMAGFPREPTSTTLLLMIFRFRWPNHSDSQTDSFTVVWGLGGCCLVHHCQDITNYSCSQSRHNHQTQHAVLHSALFKWILPFNSWQLV